MRVELGTQNTFNSKIAVILIFRKALYSLLLNPLLPNVPQRERLDKF